MIGDVMRPASALMRDRETAQDLDEVAHWLVDRDAICADQVIEWMVRGTSLSTDELASLEADRDWSWALSGVILESAEPIADDADGPLAEESPAGGDAIRGFLQGVAAGRGVGILGLDGTTQWVNRRRWTIVHPALLADRGAWRALAAEAGVAQHVQQLSRDVYLRDPHQHPDRDVTARLSLPVAQTHRPAGPSRTAADPNAPDLNAPDLDRDPVSRDRRARQAAAAAEQVETFWQDGSWLSAQFTVEAGGIRIAFRDEDGRPMRLAAVRPVVWSEAVRRAITRRG
jgi:hypothetical protein